MPWNHKTVEAKRAEFIAEARESKNMSAVCRKYNITRKTGYKWLGRAEEGEELSDRSRRPKRHGKSTEKNIEAKIIELRGANPGWGCKKLHQVMVNQGYSGLPCVKTFNNILKRNGCIAEEESKKRIPYKRFERERCNELWQTDFKGDFELGDGSRCYPLTILDDHSRYLIKIDAKGDMKGVTESFRVAFTDYGMPDSVLSDNGGTFRGLHGGFTMFERWLMEHDVLPIHGRVKHPQTQGKIERMHGAMNSELLNHRSFSDLQEAAVELELWREKYNNVRPHEALDMKCPAQIFIHSDRKYHEKLIPFEYSDEHKVVKVNSWGYVRFAGFQIFLSETFSEQFIQLRSNPLKGSWIACFRNFRVAEFDVNTGKLLNRFVRRLTVLD